MEQSTSIILALYGLVGIALATLWLRHQSVLRQRDEMRTKLGNLQGNLQDKFEPQDFKKINRLFPPIMSKDPLIWFS